MKQAQPHVLRVLGLIRWAGAVTSAWTSDPANVHVVWAHLETPIPEVGAAAERLWPVSLMASPALLLGLLGVLTPEEPALPEGASAGQRTPPPPQELERPM